MSVRPLPDSIGPYRVLRRLGRGGMAEVFVAEDTATGELHAVKRMDRRSPHPERFNQEYEALTRLNHPGVVRVYQYGQAEGIPWFSMELIAGDPLQVWIKRVGRPGTPARTKEVLRAGAFVSDAVAYIHERGLIHRDLKGSNVLMLPDGRVKLLDFGTAHIRDGIRQLTRPGEFIGTLAYASPEQLRGKALDHRVDIYALGVLFYRMITGHRPFSAKDPAELAKLITRSPPEPPSNLVDRLDPDVEALILQLLSKNPEQRPKSARNVAEWLERLTGEPLGLPGSGLRTRADRSAAREDVLRSLRRLLGPSGRLVLLLGQPGSDRTRVADALGATLRKDDETVVAARLEPGHTVLAVADTLRDALQRRPELSDRRVEAAVQALRLLLKRGQRTALDNRRGLFDAATLALVGLAREVGRVLVVLHDVHRADPPFIDLLDRLQTTTERGDLPVRFLLTAEQGPSDVMRQLQQRTGSLVRVSLAPLSVREVGLQVCAMLDRRPPPTALARSLHQATGGQPLWIEELVQELVEEGSIRLIGTDGNRIEWTVPEALPVPPTPRICSFVPCWTARPWSDGCCSPWRSPAAPHP